MPRRKASEFVVLTADCDGDRWEVCCGQIFPTQAEAKKEAEGHAAECPDARFRIARVVLRGNPSGLIWT